MNDPLSRGYHNNQTALVFWVLGIMLMLGVVLGSALTAIYMGGEYRQGVEECHELLKKQSND